MSRKKYNLSHYNLTTTDMGKLMPVGCVEVLPGDSFQHNTSALIRMLPQLKPVMHPVNAHIHHFFVPNRLLWSGWEDFITGQGINVPPTSNAVNAAGSVADIMGLPSSNPNLFEYSTLPIRAYNAIFNEYYRDQDLETPVAEESNVIQRVRWEKDYFTTARPWDTAGANITVPVKTLDTSAYTKLNVRNTTTAAASKTLQTDSLGNLSDGTNHLYPDVSDVLGMDADDFRVGLAMQRYGEARAKYGSNYVDYLRYCGVNPSDARLQRPEYLGGGKQTISFTEILNTSNTNLGSLGGHAIGALKTNKYRKYFEEHGFVITMAFVRPKALYGNQTSRKWLRTNKEDYYQKELSHIGVQEIWNKEVYNKHSNPDGIFGYQNRYSEYTTEHSYVSESMRTSVNNDWHLGRLFTADTALNASFLTCQPSGRIFALQSEPAIHMMVNHRIIARRNVQSPSIGKIL